MTIQNFDKDTKKNVVNKNIVVNSKISLSKKNIVVKKNEIDNHDVVFDKDIFIIVKKFSPQLFKILEKNEVFLFFWILFLGENLSLSKFI